MAVEDFRNHGVSPLPAQEGSRGADGKGVNLPKSTYQNPGPTENIRGIEPNTNMGAGLSEPEVQTETVEGYTRDAPFDAPFNAPSDTVGPGDPRWSGADSSAKNSCPVDIPHDSFSAAGESYPANGGLDGLT
jgi:hypothetical protein